MPHFAVQMHYNGDDDSACVDLRLFDACNGYCIVPKPTARMFLLLRLCSNLVLSLALDAVWSRKLTLIMRCPNTLQWRGWFCIYLRLSNGWCIGPKQTGRTFVLLPACVLELEGVSGFQCSMSLLFYLSHVMSKYTTMAMTTLCWSLLVECMERVSCWRLALHEQRVRLYYCVCALGIFSLNVLDFNGVIGDWCSRRS